MNTVFDLKNTLRPHLATLTAYSSARDDYAGKEGVFLDANENSLGSVMGQQVMPGAYNRYPDPHQWALKQKIAPMKGVAEKQIFLGNGSDEAIDLLIRATATPGRDSILIMPPTYGMYEVSASIHDVGVVRVPLTADFQIDAQQVLASVTAHTKLIWVCSPNNPSGNLLHPEAIETLLNNFDGLVVVDEAYIDFTSGASWTQRLADFANLVVLQTFSKAWGLAALRLGMCFASAELIAVLNKIKPPYNLSGPAQELLLQALEEGEAVKNTLVQQIVAERTRLTALLSELTIVRQIHHSDANFLLVAFDNAAAIMRYLLDNQIIVRDRSRVTLCDGCLRITVGTPPETELLIKALRTYQQNPVLA